MTTNAHSRSSAFVHRFVQSLRSAAAAARDGAPGSSPELPEYDFLDGAEADSLIRLSRPLAFSLGTGASIYSQVLLPAVLSATHEVILVTCFWAESKSLASLGAALAALARRRWDQRRLAGDGDLGDPLRVRICLSSRSLLQKLFHPSECYVYPPAAWPAQLGLPPQDLLVAGGIDLVVKSLFFLPFSVMHPKFLVIDRSRAFVPSCNVSWESWLEGCLELESPPAGPDAVAGLIEFYRRTWERDRVVSDRTASTATLTVSDAVISSDEAGRDAGVLPIASPAHTSVALSGQSPITTIWLPSPHHRNPQFRPLPWQTVASPPQTPLNIALLQLLDTAQHDVYIQTPNLTSAPAIDAILSALSRGVDVTMVTSKNMMLLEQLVTAGTTTAWCLSRLIARYRALSSLPQSAGGGPDLEAQRQAVAPGRFRVSYYRASRVAEEEPVHSHLKLTIVDGEFTVLGSGNLDRASWYTSQELGVLLCGREFAAKVRAAVDGVLQDGRLDGLFDSTAS